MLEMQLESSLTISVFQRALEYYAGILFLTTNRVGVFDDAYISPPLEPILPRGQIDANPQSLENEYSSYTREPQIR